MEIEGEQSPYRRGQRDDGSGKEGTVDDEKGSLGSASCAGRWYERRQCKDDPLEDPEEDRLHWCAEKGHNGRHDRIASRPLDPRQGHAEREARFAIRADELEDLSSVNPGRPHPPLQPPSDAKPAL